MTARFHSPGTPFSACAPDLDSRPVRSPGHAACWTPSTRSAPPTHSTRAPMCTAIPPMSSPRHFALAGVQPGRRPQCRAIAPCRGLPWRSGWLAAVQSNISKEASRPMCSPHDHGNETVATGRRRRAASSSGIQSRSPMLHCPAHPTATMSVNSTVARTRSVGHFCQSGAGEELGDFLKAAATAQRSGAVLARRLGRVLCARYVIGDVLAPLGWDERMVSVWWRTRVAAPGLWKQTPARPFRPAEASQERDGASARR